MEPMFLRTKDGMVNGRCVVLMYQNTVGGFTSEDYEVHYEFGDKIRTTSAKASDVQTFTDGPSMPC